MIIHVNEENFEEVVMKNDKLVILDFFATWCMPCKMLSPVFEKVSEKYDGKVTFCKIDIDNNSNLTEKYEIVSVPTLVFVKNGQMINQEIGSRNENELEEVVNKYM